MLDDEESACGGSQLLLESREKSAGSLTLTSCQTQRIMDTGLSGPRNGRTNLEAACGAFITTCLKNTMASSSRYRASFSQVIVLIQSMKMNKLERRSGSQKCTVLSFSSLTTSCRHTFAHTPFIFLNRSGGGMVQPAAHERRATSSSKKCGAIRIQCGSQLMSIQAKCGRSRSTAWTAWCGRLYEGRTHRMTLPLETCTCFFAGARSWRAHARIQPLAVTTKEETARIQPLAVTTKKEKPTAKGSRSGALSLRRVSTQPAASLAVRAACSFCAW